MSEKATTSALASYYRQGDPANPDQENHHQILHLSKDTTGFFVVHDSKFGIIVQAETEAKAVEIASEAINVLWTNFPDIHDREYPNHVSAKSFKELKNKKGAIFTQEVLVAPTRR